MATYRVIWECEYDADSPQQAVAEAMQDIANVLKTPDDGPNFFEVIHDLTGEETFVEAHEAALPHGWRGCRARLGRRW